MMDVAGVEVVCWGGFCGVSVVCEEESVGGFVCKGGIGFCEKVLAGFWA